jgi:hypothetical protein
VVIKTEEELEAFEAEMRSVGLKSRTRTRIDREIRRQKKGESKSEPTHSEAYKRRKSETELDTVLEEIVIPHARKWAKDVWPGGTVDVDEIAFFWNPQLTNAAGMAYKGRSVPKRYVDRMKYDRAIGLAPEYFYKRGLDELLEVVRHELIHIWQYNHENGKATGGHGPDFKQWLGDMDTHRHCKFW